MSECYNNLRFSLSDDSGELQFENFDIADPQCRQFADRLREYLVSRPLKELDPERIRFMQCPGAGECAATVAAVVEDYQRLFRQKAATGEIHG